MRDWEYEKRLVSVTRMSIIITAWPQPQAAPCRGGSAACHSTRPTVPVPWWRSRGCLLEAARTTVSEGRDAPSMVT